MSKSPFSSARFRNTFFGGWIVWAFLHVLLIRNFGFSTEIAILDSAVTNIQLLGACWLVNLILKYYLPGKERYWYILVLSSGLSLLVWMITKVILSLVLKGQANYIEFVSASWPVRLVISFLQICCTSIVSVLWYTIEEEQENLRRKTDAERMAREAELFKLRQQLQPHFLFNSLNSISALIGSQPEMARTMIHQLSDFLRGTLKKEEQQWVNLSEELQYLQLYLEIEKVRFGHRLNAIVDCEASCKIMKLPAMILQPLVENAIKFGLYDTTESVTIRVQASCSNRDLKVVIQNPYDPETSHKGTGFGLSSVKRRLYLLLGRSDLLETKAEQNLFTTTILIPQLI